MSNGIRCHICDKRVPSFTALIRHFKNAHQVDHEAIKGTYVHTQSMLERPAKPPPAMSDLEAEYVSPAVDEDNQVAEEKFACLKCWKILSKLSCHRHMVRKHDLCNADVKGWLTVKDGKTIENTEAECVNTKRLRMTRAWNERMQAVQPRARDRTTVNIHGQAGSDYKSGGLVGRAVDRSVGRQDMLIPHLPIAQPPHPTSPPFHHPTLHTHPQLPH